MFKVSWPGLNGESNITHTHTLKITAWTPWNI